MILPISPGPGNQSENASGASQVGDRPMLRYIFGANTIRYLRVDDLRTILCGRSMCTRNGRLTEGASPPR